MSRSPSGASSRSCTPSCSRSRASTRRRRRIRLDLFYQAYRCWYFPFTLIPGAAPTTARARAAIVEASLGKDVVSYYRQGQWRMMAEQPVLVLGETGTGKELAGKCLAGGRFIPFDKATRRFAAAPLAGHHVVNLSDASDALFDAELSGNVRGASGSRGGGRGSGSTSGSTPRRRERRDDARRRA